MRRSTEPPTSACVKRLQKELILIQRDEKVTADLALTAASASASAATTGGTSVSSTATTAPTATSTSTTPAQQTVDTATGSAQCFLTARPDPDAILDWYFIIAGPEATPYQGGTYIGKLEFPPDYPFKAPDTLMLTPSGRFETHTRLCTTNSAYHPEEWSPMWNVRTIVLGLVSFMAEDQPGIGAIRETAEVRRTLAMASRRHNATDAAVAPLYRRVFPELFEADLASLQAEKKEEELAPVVKDTAGGLNINHKPNRKRARHNTGKT